MSLLRYNVTRKPVQRIIMLVLQYFEKVQMQNIEILCYILRRDVWNGKQSVVNKCSDLKLASGECVIGTASIWIYNEISMRYGRKSTCNFTLETYEVIVDITINNTVVLWCSLDLAISRTSRIIAFATNLSCF